MYHRVHARLDALRGGAVAWPDRDVLHSARQLFGAALVLLSQATLLDIYSPERRGFAMAIWGVGAAWPGSADPTVGGWPPENQLALGVLHQLLLGLLAAATMVLPASSGRTSCASTGLASAC